MKRIVKESHCDFQVAGFHGDYLSLFQVSFSSPPLHLVPSEDKMYDPKQSMDRLLHTRAYIAHMTLPKNSGLLSVF